MELVGRKVMVLGATGLVGQAICRALLKERPGELILCALGKADLEQLRGRLEEEKGEKGLGITCAAGNIFVRDEHKEWPREEMLANSAFRRDLIEDVLGDLTEETLGRSFAFRLIAEHRPEVVVDCINSATALAYQDLYLGSRRLLRALGREEEGAVEAEAEKLICTLYIPQLIRHVHIMFEAMKRARSHLYLKVGTSGTGGMGLNLPYTHSEERPSKVLLSKASLAGAHSMLLFLMGRTPGAPITKEVKPATFIAWKEIAFGPIIRRGWPAELYDCPPQAALPVEEALRSSSPAEGPWVKLMDPSGSPRLLESVYIDTGENGLFAKAEFETISSTGQMEFVTPEEIAEVAIRELRGGNTGRDIVAALDGAVMGPSYRAGALRDRAIREMTKLEEAHQVESIAFEMLGPPRLTKLLYEASLLRRLYTSLRGVSGLDPAEASSRAWEEVQKDQDFRATILSVGVPILLPQADRLLRGPLVKMPPDSEEGLPPMDAEAVEHWAGKGWLDLREVNFVRWRARARAILKEVEALSSEGTGSAIHEDRAYWSPDEPLSLGKLASWILRLEEEGIRLK